MDERILKDIENQKQQDFGHILHQLETIERVYPYYANMIQDHMSTQSTIEPNLKSSMRKGNRD